LRDVKLPSNREKVFLYERNKSLLHVADSSHAFLCILRSQQLKAINSTLCCNGRVGFYHIKIIETNTTALGLKEEAVDDYGAGVMSA
jgi:hypothetical protein